MGEGPRRKRTDDNQTAIVEAARAIGASVVVTSDLGDGFPDLVVGFRGETEMAEVKSATGKLSPRQRRFQREWNGRPIRIWRSCDDMFYDLGLC